VNNRRPRRCNLVRARASVIVNRTGEKQISDFGLPPITVTQNEAKKEK